MRAARGDRASRSGGAGGGASGRGQSPDALPESGMLALRADVRDEGNVLPPAGVRAARLTTSAVATGYAIWNNNRKESGR